MRKNLTTQLAGSGLSRTNIAPPGHEELEPQDLSKRLKLLITEALKVRGIETRGKRKT